MNTRELRRALASFSVDPRFYDLDGASPAASEGIVLGYENGQWRVSSFERNHWYVYGEFENEDDACALVLKLLSDPAYRRQ
jgi:hypothetical protein